MGTRAVSVSCRTRSTSQAMTSRARRGTAARPRVLPSVRHWVTGGQAGQAWGRQHRQWRGRRRGWQPGTGRILLTLGERWLCGCRLEAVQEVFALEGRWKGQDMSEACGEHPTTPSCTPLPLPAPHCPLLCPTAPTCTPPATPAPCRTPLHPHAPYGALLHPTTPCCIVLHPTAPHHHGSSPSPPTPAALCRRRTAGWPPCKGRRVLSWGYPLAQHPDGHGVGSCTFPNWCTPQALSWGGVGQDRALLWLEGSAGAGGCPRLAGLLP